MINVEDVLEDLRKWLQQAQQQAALNPRGYAPDQDQLALQVKRVETILAELNQSEGSLPPLPSLTEIKFDFPDEAARFAALHRIAQAAQLGWKSTPQQAAHVRWSVRQIKLMIQQVV